MPTCARWRSGSASPSWSTPIPAWADRSPFSSRKASRCTVWSRRRPGRASPAAAPADQEEDQSFEDDEKRLHWTRTRRSHRTMERLRSLMTTRARQRVKSRGKIRERSGTRSGRPQAAPAPTADGAAARGVRTAPSSASPLLRLRRNCRAMPWRTSPTPAVISSSARARTPRCRGRRSSAGAERTAESNGDSERPRRRRGRRGGRRNRRERDGDLSSPKIDGSNRTRRAQHPIPMLRPAATQNATLASCSASRNRIRRRSRGSCRGGSSA